ncbi:hypothetical protein PVAG01_09680 [Phlyctema vagabunda]|uniref:Uncharacterized protein n=1 Tax=Phlyctema vagabunda TaxID=108571 RepID=A0ABR4P821_9HELO
MHRPAPAPAPKRPDHDLSHDLATREGCESKEGHDPTTRPPADHFCDRRSSAQRTALC